LAEAGRGTFVTFYLGGEEHACDVFDVIEVTPAMQVTGLPGASPAIAGVVTWRGRTVPVVDLNLPLEPARSGVPPRRPLLLLRGPDPFALRIDRAGEILSAGKIASTEPPDDQSVDWVVAVLHTERGSVPVLDPARVAAAAGCASTGELGPHLEENQE
jgi:chemotaxis signal transduction protein